jgi:hypothetical protein
MPENIPLTPGFNRVVMMPGKCKTVLTVCLRFITPHEKTVETVFDTWLLPEHPTQVGC